MEKFFNVVVNIIVLMMFALMVASITSIVINNNRVEECVEQGGLVIESTTGRTCINQRD